MISNIYLDLLQELKDKENSTLYNVFKTKLIQLGLNIEDVIHHQWLEVWLETTSSESIALTTQGIYSSKSRREIILHQLNDLLIERLNLKGLNALPTPKSVIDRAVVVDVENWLEFEADWILEFLTLMFCKDVGIASTLIEPYQSNRYSVMADSFNERTMLAEKAILYIESGDLAQEDFDLLFKYYGGPFLLAFCKTDILKQRILNSLGEF